MEHPLHPRVVHPEVLLAHADPTALRAALGEGAAGSFGDAHFGGGAIEDPELAQVLALSMEEQWGGSGGSSGGPSHK